MARARNIKPGFFRNADLVELPVETRMLFIGLWTLADREGRLADRPKQIRMEIYPADSFDVDTMLQSLHDTGFILRYEVNGIRYIQVNNFHKHQNPHHRELPSTCPQPVPAQGKPEACPSPAVLIPDSGFLNPESGSKRQQGATTVGPQAPEPQNPTPFVSNPGAPDAAPDPAPPPDNETPPPGENPPSPAPHADAITARSVEIAVLLRNRGAGVAAGEVRLREWAGRGITDAALLTALETATQRRADAGSVQPVNSGLLDSILADAPSPSGGAPPARASPRGGGRQAARDAYLADAAVAAKKHGLDETGGADGRNERDISGQCARVA